MSVAPPARGPRCWYDPPVAEFTLLTLNAFGLPMFLASRRWPRLVRELHHHPVSVLCLQEVQQNYYLKQLLRDLKGYEHFAYHPHRLAPRGGLFTASRLPVERSQFLAYEHRGRWLSAAAGDRLLGKGWLSTQQRHGGLDVVVLNTHLNANYSGDWSPANGFARVLLGQVRQLAAHVRALPADALVVVCGDFNFPRASFLYRELFHYTGLVDPLADDPRPTYRPFSVIPARYALPIDFVLVRVPARLAVAVHADIRPFEDSSALHVRRRFLSDHCALTLRLSWADPIGHLG